MHVQSIRSRIAVAGLLMGLLSGLQVGNARAEQPVVQEVLDILKERGIVDEARYTELSAKNASYEKENTRLLGRIEISGDLRTRVEGFWFESDPFDGDSFNRFRALYRLRLNAKATINDYINAHFRLATGNISRSTNSTLGRDNDFDPDGLFVHRAYLEVNPIRAELMPMPGGKLTINAGKVPNPFLWKIGKDYLLWDHDINPEGVSVQVASSPSEWLSLFLNGGYFIIDENAFRSDPHVLGLQVGAHYRPEGPFEVGARASWYSFRSLDGDFFARNAASGNIIDGLTGETMVGGGDGADDGIEAIELAGYAKWKGNPQWPVVLYGHYLRNTDGRHSVSIPGAAEEDSAWGIGLEVGDKREVVLLGGGFYVTEANAWPARFADSDLFDGFPNRRGYTAYIQREILENTTLGVTVFVSDEIDNDIDKFPVSIRDGERIRLQADLAVRF